jgi:hypothetical protein
MFDCYDDALHRVLAANKRTDTRRPSPPLLRGIAGKAESMRENKGYCEDRQGLLRVTANAHRFHIVEPFLR